MITFQQLCEHLTCNQRNAWFYFEPELFDALDDVESLLVWKELCTSQYHRLWYPREKFYTRTMSKEEKALLITAALEKEDFTEVSKLQKIKTYD